MLFITNRMKYKIEKQNQDPDFTRNCYCTQSEAPIVQKGPNCTRERKQNCKDKIETEKLIQKKKDTKRGDGEAKAPTDDRCRRGALGCL